MATNTKRQMIQLPADMARELRENQSQIDAAKQAIDALKRMGMDTSELESQIAWAEKTTKILLEEFS